MKTCATVLINSILFAFALAGATLAAEVTIDPAGYTGEWSVDYGPTRRGVAVVKLGPPDATTGAHVISISGAELFFNVAPDGKVTVENSVAAVGGPGRLTFNNVAIFVDPVYFSGDWRISNGATRDLRGPQLITLVPGLEYYSLEIGATGGFSFDIAGNSKVKVHNDMAASGSMGYLRFKNTRRFLSETQ